MVKIKVRIHKYSVIFAIILLSVSICAAGGQGNDVGSQIPSPGLRIGPIAENSSPQNAVQGTLVPTIARPTKSPQITPQNVTPYSIKNTTNASTPAGRPTPVTIPPGGQSGELQSASPALGTPNTYSPDRVIIKFKPGKIASKNGKARVTAAAHAAMNSKVIKDFDGKGIAGYQVVQLPKGISVEEAIARYKKNPDIELAEPDYRVSIETIPNDPGYSSLWGLGSISAPEAWNLTTGSPEVIVAVIDTGVDYNHTDLAANIWINTDEIPDNGVDDDGNGYIDDVRGWNFVAKNNDPMDNNNHGTHSAGTISAVGNNGIGVTGVAWDVKIMPLKFMDNSGNGYNSDAVDAILYANANGASIISNSWGGSPYYSLLYDVIQQSNAVVVCSAGNANQNDDLNPNYPASYSCDNIITVAASDSSNNRAWFSNYGLTSVDVAAPGVDINSTMKGNSYGLMQGTSMATPHVAGIAALIKSENPTLTNLQIKQFIMNNVDPLPALSGITVTGGKVNAYKAVNAAHPMVAPASITDLHNSSYQQSWITWNWTDPSSSDFSKVLVYLDGVFQANVTKGVRTYTASSLISDTEHTIATRTVGTTGLVNQTWVNDTARTAPDAPSFGSAFIQSTPSGAKIYLDYTDTEFVTPKTLSNLATGNHVIRYNLSGYDDTTQTVSITSGQTTNVTITLQKSGSFAPKADFVASTREGGSPLLVQFTDKSINSPTSWSWTFGDGSTSNEQNPPHTYLKAGLYSVKLKVSNPSGANGLSKSGYIVVSGSTPTMGSISIQSNPTGAKIYLDDVDTGFVTPKTISNVPVGSHVIRCSLSGYSDNSQTVSVSEGQTAMVSLDLVSAPPFTGSISIQSNPTGAKIYLDDADIGFVSPKTISNVPVGSHVIRCSLSGYSDNSQTVSVLSGQTTDVNIILQKSGNVAPKPDFSASVRDGTSPLPVQFTDKSTNSPTTWLWTFGDGSTSNIQNPTHTYLKTGIYSVKLKVSNPTGTNGLSRSGYIVVS